ncbi:RNA polymerase sigma-70 factor [Pedobacter hiemivivus]|uniref:RNA polymerase sigma-70 factor n=1 Tax=Pedobacter hiemivivus TaxID=2530454 RepID=UPI001F19A2AA|nr:RNA polymerase sigma-70 factor [Pedobacter hiemivivus]
MLKPKRSVNILFQEIQAGSQDAFNALFLNYYDKLVAFSQQYVKQIESAEEITSELFVKIWLKRDTLLKVLNPEVYLYISIKNASLNQLRAARKHQVVSTDDEEQEQVSILTVHHGTELEKKELVKLLDLAVEALPEQRRIIFRLIKEDELKSKEVAQILNISVRTVENQMYKAVKSLADAISSYLGYHPQKRISKKQALSSLSILYFF